MKILLTFCMHGEIHVLIDEITMRISLEPENGALYFQRAQYYQQDGDFDRAFADFLLAQDLDSTLVTVEHLLAELCFEHHFPHMAKAYADRYLSRFPDDPLARFNRAAILLSLNKDTNAITDIQAAFHSLKTPQPKHYLMAARAELLADSTNFDGAMQWLNLGEGKLGFNIVLIEKAIEMALQFQYYDYALSEVERVLEKMPRKEKWYLMKGEILEAMRYHDQADAAFRDCISTIEALPRRYRMTRAVLDLQARAIMKLELHSEKSK